MKKAYGHNRGSDVYLGTLRSTNGYTYDIYIAKDHSYWVYRWSNWDARIVRQFVRGTLNLEFWNQVEPFLQKAMDPSISPNVKCG